MKVLWFSNSPCGSIKRNPASAVKSGGWLISLEAEIKKENNIQLEVAFFTDKQENPFTFDGVKYYPMWRNFYKIRNGLNRIRERFISQEDKDKKALPIMLDVVKQSLPDIIHIHGTEESFGLITDYIKDIPIVFSIQGLLAPYSEKYFSGMPDKDIYKYESIKDKLKRVSYRDEYKSFCVRASREIFYLEKAQYVFGRTFWDEYITGLLNPRRKYFVVDEILRSPFYKVQWRNRDYRSRRYRIISTISGGIYKGFETVLKTARLLKRYADFDFEWIIAGYGNQDKWVQIAEKLTSIKSSEVNIAFKGRIDAEELSSLLEISDVYVHVSHIENSPNSVCEAMLVGMPVIASFSGGTGTLLDNEREGILIQDGDSYAYAGAVIKMHSHFDMAQRLGECARFKAINRHNPNRISLQLFKAYQDIIIDFKRNNNENTFCQ